MNLWLTGWQASMDVCGQLWRRCRLAVPSVPAEHFYPFEIVKFEHIFFLIRRHFETMSYSLLSILTSWDNVITVSTSKQWFRDHGIKRVNVIGYIKRKPKGKFLEPPKSPNGTYKLHNSRRVRYGVEFFLFLYLVFHFRVFLLAYLRSKIWFEE